MTTTDPKRPELLFFLGLALGLLLGGGSISAMELGTIADAVAPCDPIPEPALPEPEPEPEPAIVRPVE